MTIAKYSNYLFKLILSVLKRRDMYGYELSKIIAEETHNYVVPKHGTMYPIIYKLIEDQYISNYTLLVKNKARVYYHIEQKGMNYLHQLIKKYDNLVYQINNFIHGENKDESK